MAKTVKSYIKDTNDFLRNLKGLGKLSKNAILCNVDVVGLHPIILHEEDLWSLRKHLDVRTKDEISTGTLVELTEIVLKNNVFNFILKICRQKISATVGTRFAPPYFILSMSDLEERILENFDLKPYIWCLYIDDNFFI